MAGLSELGQLLHEEHFRILVAACELENRIRGASADRPLDTFDAEDNRLLKSLLDNLDRIIVHHAFEEAVVFPLIRDNGERELTTLLTREHGAIEPKARLVGLLGRQLLGRVASADEWARFRHAAADLVAEVMLHLEKEELTIVQRLPSLLDASTDHELALRHGSQARSESESPWGGTEVIADQAPCRTSRAAFTRSEAAARAARRRSTMPSRPRA